MTIVPHIARTAPMLAFCLAAASCTDQPTSLVVEVKARPAVSGTQTLRVKVAAGGIGQDRPFTFAPKEFPQTFSVSTTSLANEDLTIQVEALDGDRVIGQGEIVAKFTDKNATILLEPNDFLVNDVVVGAQALNEDRDTNGFQLAAHSNGNWDVVYRSTTDAAQFEWFGRRFDSAARNVVTAATMQDSAWKFTSSPVSFSATAALVAGPSKTVAVWEEGMGPTGGIFCRPISADNGTLGDSIIMIASDTAADVVSAAKLANGKIAVVWAGRTMANDSVVRSVIIDENCAVQSGSLQEVSTVALTSLPRPSVAANSSGFLVAWLGNGEVRAQKMKNIDGTRDATERVLLPNPAASTVVNNFVRLVPMGDGFGAIVQRTETSGGSFERIELMRLSTTGAIEGLPVVVALDTNSEVAPAAASFGGNSPVVVSWEQCDVDQSNCEINARVFLRNSQPIGETFVVNTTTTGKQVSPSVAMLNSTGEPQVVIAWTDEGRNPPDTSMDAVRARVVYPAVEEAAGILGANCQNGKPLCAEGLVCAASSDGFPRCAAPCSPPGACQFGGTCRRVPEEVCTF